jgi:hypothetical protein
MRKSSVGKIFFGKFLIGFNISQGRVPPKPKAKDSGRSKMRESVNKNDGFGFKIFNADNFCSKPLTLIDKLI